MFVKRRTVYANAGFEDDSRSRWINNNMFKPKRYWQEHIILAEHFHARYNQHSPNEIPSFLFSHWRWLINEYNINSPWNIYFESARMLCTRNEIMMKIPTEYLSHLNVHIVTRQQARFEANAILMGYLRHVLKHQIASSDNTRVIVQCIEASLLCL